MLNIDPVVKINVNVGSSTASEGVFDVGAILTTTIGAANGTGGGAVLSSAHRFAEYNSISEVLNGVTNAAPLFADTSDVYKAAAKYFGASPAPMKLVVIYYNPAASTPETPAFAMLDAIDKGAEFYAVYMSPYAEYASSDVKAQIISIASALEGLNRGVEFYGVTGTVESVTADGSALSDVYASNTRRAIGMYCTSETDDAAALMGVAMGYSRTSGRDAFALCYKSVSTATVNSVTQTEVSAIKALNGNVLVQRTRDRAYVENGAVASGLRFDDVLFIDRMSYDIQQAIYEMIANSPTKLPQRDTTSALFTNAIASVLEPYYRGGILAEAPWRGRPVGAVETGDIIDHGHTEFADGSYDDQSEADRALHKAVPITVLLCLAGSVETIVITVDVQT